MAKPLIRLNDGQCDEFIKFINQYGSSTDNPATSSKLDPNANVTTKTIGTLEAEMMKGPNIQINRRLMYRKIKEMFGESIAEEYIRQLEDHEIYTHDESSLKPYCVSVSLYPFLTNGTIPLGGNAKAPQHLSSFVGEYINLVYEIASHFAGAVATVEFLMYFDYFAKKDFGKDYIDTKRSVVDNYFAQVVYSINEPAVARGNQSVFLNWSLFDETYFTGLFGDFVFPDGTRPEYESLYKLQYAFLEWFREENTERLLSFPVLTASAVLDDTGKYVDERFYTMLATEMSRGARFFVYESKSVDSLSSCCRLKNKLGTDKPVFSYTLGAGGVSTGSTNVITLNVSRLMQKEGLAFLSEEIRKIHMYHVAHRAIIEDQFKDGLLPPYNEGYIHLKDQFLTVGLLGILEGYETTCEYGPCWDEGYTDYVKALLKIVYDENRSAEKAYGYRFNTEMVPGESLGVKFAQWDKADGYAVPRDCYNSYLYPVEREIMLPLKALLHGSDTGEYLDGGSALHINLPELPSYAGAKNILNLMAKYGVPYFGINVLMTGCKDCGRNHPNTTSECYYCGSTNLRYATRVIGYCKWIDNFSAERQEEAKRRSYVEHR